MTKSYLSLLALALTLSGCSSNPYSVQSSAPQGADAAVNTAPTYNPTSEAEAVLIRQLPADADIENMPEQRRLVPQGLYLNWAGQRQDLNAKPASAKQHSLGSQAPAADVRKRAPTTQESITLDELPPPIVIE